MLSMNLLNCQTSLTKALQNIAKGSLQLKVLNQGWQAAPAAVQLSLTLEQNETIWCREIQFEDDSGVLEWAQTWISATAFSYCSALKDLNTSSIGTLLFADDSDFIRTSFSVHALSEEDNCYSQLLDLYGIQQQKIRCSVFSDKNGNPLLVIYEALNPELY